MPDVALVHEPAIDKISYGPAHPFVVGRAGRTVALCQRRGLADPTARVVRPKAAEREDLLTFHTPGYVDLLASAEHSEPTEAWLAAGLGTEDCPVFPGLWDYVRTYAGGSLTAVGLLLESHYRRVFHPAGGLHHAMPDRAAGFCYVNDVVLAVQRLVDSGLRVCVLDLDAHHGDGTQLAFYEDPRVLTVSVHESGKTLFPWGGWPEETGAGPGRGTNVNVPLPAGAYDDLFVRAVERIVLPVVERFGPDVLVLEIGGDVLASDPMTHLKLSNNAVARAVELLLKFDLPWLLVGGGGYDVEATVRLWTVVWSIAIDRPLHDDYAGLIGGAMTGLADLRGGDLRDPYRYVPQEEREELSAEFQATLEKLERLFDLS